jgi:ATP-binding cassette subfamily B protein
MSLTYKMEKTKNMKKNNKKRKTEYKIDTRYNLSVYWSFLKKYKFQWIILLIFGFIVSATYILEKFLFKVIIDRGTEFAAGSLAREAFIGVLLIIVIVFLSSFIIRGILNYVNLHLLFSVTAKMMSDLKRRFFNHIIGLSHNFHTSHKTGGLISKLIKGGGAIDRMNDVIAFNTLPLLFQLILVSGSLLYFDLLPAVVILVTCVCFVGWSIILQNKAKPLGATYHIIEDSEKSNISDFLINIDSIKHFGKEKNIEKRFDKLTDKTRRAWVDYVNFFRAMSAGQQIILGIGVFLLVFFPMLKFLNGDLSIGTMVFIYTIYGNIASPLWGFVHGTREYYRAMVEFEALFQYGKVKNDIKDKPDAKLLKIEKGEVEFKNINFKYGKRKMFSKFNLKIPENKKFALVGHSGCGKTTLVNLLYRFYDVDSGKISIDGEDIKDFKQESLREEMAIVPQECLLFDDTIYNNVAFSNPKSTRKEVMQAMKFAQLDKIVKEFPNKERTIVGERGVKLSGGEKQRVSIARAILANKKILVLDEATSSLDSQTEHEIQRDLKKLMEGRTSIIIAHRLSTIMHADMIIVMKKGKIVQMGKHNQLIKQAGEYKHLWNLQKGGYIK